MTLKISIIIPVYNEKKRLPALLESLSELMLAGHEVILVDGGSTDGFSVNSAQAGLKIVAAEKCRSLQMNAGAAQAQGDVFWFLHADTQFPESVLQYSRLLSALNTQQWGRFNIRLDGTRSIFRVIESMMNWRSAISGIATGDQGIFVGRQLFDEVGGFSPIAIMEDVDLSIKLKKICQPIISKKTLLTSSRRWERRGVWKTILLMWKMRWLYFWGADPSSLVKLYE